MYASLCRAVLCPGVNLSGTGNLPGNPRPRWLPRLKVSPCYVWARVDPQHTGRRGFGRTLVFFLVISLVFLFFYPYSLLLSDLSLSLSFSLSLSSSSLHPLLFSCSAALNLSIPLRDLPLLYWLNARRQNTPAGPPAQPSGCNSWLPSLWSRGRLIRGTSVDKTRTSHASATGQSRPPSTQTVILGLNSFKPVFKGDQ